MQGLFILTVMLLLLVAMAVRRHAPSKAVINSTLARLLRQQTIVIRDRAAAHRLLVRGCVGGAFSNRPASTAPTAVISQRRYHNLTTAPYGPYWRIIRRNLTSQVLNPQRLHRYAAARRDALRGLVADLREQCASNPDGVALAAESMRAAIFGLSATMCFGEGLDKVLVRAMAEAQHEFISFFPKLRVFAKRPALARLIHRKRWSKLLAYRRKQEDMYLPLIHARRTRQRQSGETPTYVDTLIDLWVPVPDDRNASKRRRQRRLADGEIVGLCAEFLGAGTETVASELQFIMANLVKHPHMHMVLKEDDIVHNGQRIPVGTEMFFLPESLARDKTVWADPDDFKPERFLASKGGEMVSLVAAAGSGGGEVMMMPFGAGRRVCPGIGVAMLHMSYFMANLIKEFEWREGEGELAVDLRPHYSFITIMKRPLRAHLVPLPTTQRVYQIPDCNTSGLCNLHL